MSNLQVSETNVPGVIKKLKTSEWLSPLFQREFVWSTASVINLVNSIIDARPVGMITLWEQEGKSTLPLEPISIPDRNSSPDTPGLVYYGRSDPAAWPGRYYAILDGRQRSTALALAFGGLRATSGLFRNSGRYFLDVTATEDSERVKYISEKDIQRKKLDKLNVAISDGLFPLEVSDPDKIFDQWMDYLQFIRDAAYYKDGILPTEDELQRRNKILQRAFNGIIKTKIAVYTVPQAYNLAEICDIFETLNTTGTKVSTVDLIHSNIYSDTATSSSGPILIRDKIDELGELEGAIGWASSRDRPELIAQIAAAIHVALDKKPEPRPTGGPKEFRISSVKSQDLLALSANHWRNIFDQSSQLAGFLGGFQQAVAGGQFTMAQCPYPASASVYVALRWFREFDSNVDTEWEIRHLDSIFRAFFWRNVFDTRYDQGFLSQIGTDIQRLKTHLNGVKKGDNFESWRATSNAWLDDNVAKATDRDSVYNIITDGGEAGALKRASILLLYARADRDVVDTSIPINMGTSQQQLHHIFPKDWCANNNFGKNSEFIDSKQVQKDYINSAANLIPMARTSNILWRKKAPAQFINESELNYDSRSDLWSSYFVSRDCFSILASENVDPGKFWSMRAEIICDEISRRMMV
jgi:hypothetical protein